MWRYLFLLLSLPFFAIGVEFNNSQASEIEINKAKEISVSINKYLEQGQVAFFEAKRSEINLNIYADVEVIKINEMIATLRKDFYINEAESIQINLHFFHPRKYEEETRSDGVKIKKLIKENSYYNFELERG